MNKPSETEEVYKAVQVGLMLNLGGAMLRRYAATYEEVTGSEITVHKREGRLFNQEQVDTLLKARELVTTQGLSVRAAVQIALSKDVDSIALRSAERRSEAPYGEEMGKDALAQSATFSEVVKEAVRDGNKELVEEMRLLRASLESNSKSEHNSGKLVSQEKPIRHGPFVRFALWLEGLFGR